MILDLFALLDNKAVRCTFVSILLLLSSAQIFAQTDTGDPAVFETRTSAFERRERGETNVAAKSVSHRLRHRREFVFEKQTSELLNMPVEKKATEIEMPETAPAKPQPDALSDAKKYLRGEKTSMPAADEKEDPPVDKFHTKNAFLQSMLFLGIKHGFRMTQKKTTRELKGPFFGDWFRSVKGLQGWRDGDNAFTNYVAHPLQGGVMNRIFINNSDRAGRQEFGKSKEYWISRLKSAAWTTAWNIQFELGPLSEASLGNVGMRRKNGYSTMGYVDLIITPTVGTGVALGEDAIDKYILKNWFERKSVKAGVKIKLLRSVLTPTMSFSNLLRGKYPWKRNDR